jgi:hypothetical protein
MDGWVGASRLWVACCLLGCRAGLGDCVIVIVSLCRTFAPVVLRCCGVARSQEGGTSKRPGGAEQGVRRFGGSGVRSFGVRKKQNRRANRHLGACRHCVIAHTVSSEQVIKRSSEQVKRTLASWQVSSQPVHPSTRQRDRSPHERATKNNIVSVASPLRSLPSPVQSPGQTYSIIHKAKVKVLPASRSSYIYLVQQRLLLRVPQNPSISRASE